MLSLDDVLSAPRDPELLNRHLQNLGLLPMPETQPAETIAPMTPPIVPSPGGPSTKLPPLSRPHLPAMHSEEMPEAPVMSAPNVQPDMGATVKPMTPPTLSAEEQKQLPLTSPGMEGGSVPFYQQRLDEAIARNRHDSMSDHPSFLGKVGHVLGRIGNVALDVAAPGVAENIPGTDLYKQATVRNAERNLAAEQERESQGKLRGAQTEELEARARKEAETGPDLMQDANGNLVGWRDEKGGIHSIDEEGTPQAIKDIAENWEGKQVKLPEGETPLGKDRVSQLNGAMAQRYQVLHPNQKLPDDYTLSDNATQKDFDRLDKIMQQSENASATDAQRKEANGFRSQQLALTKELAQERSEDRKEKSDEKLVRAYDKDGNEYLMPQGQAKEQGLTHLSAATGKEIDDAKQNFAALNDMGAKVKNLANSIKALDQNAYQKTLIQTALKGHPDDYGVRTATALMSDQSKEYVMDVRSLREAALALPKQTTGGSRVSEPQAMALWNTVPATGGDSKYGTSQLKKFDENLTRLWKKVPNVEGQSRERAFGEQTGGGGAPQGKTAVYNPQGEQHFVDSDKVEKFLNDPNYKGWSRNAPNK